MFPMGCNEGRLKLNSYQSGVCIGKRGVGAFWKHVLVTVSCNSRCGTQHQPFMKARIALTSSQTPAKFNLIAIQLFHHY